MSINRETVKDQLAALRESLEESVSRKVIERVVINEGERIEDIPGYDPNKDYIIIRLVEAKPKHEPVTFEFPCRLNAQGEPLGSKVGDFYIAEDGIKYELIAD
jgi:hypothetical protein